MTGSRRTVRDPPVLADTAFYEGIHSMKKQTSFKDELQKSLIVHALIPCLLSILLLIVIVTAIGLFLISGSCQKAGEVFSEKFIKMERDYSQKAQELSESLSVADFLSSSDYRVEEISDIYQFLNQQEIRGEYYLFDNQYNLLYSTGNNPTLEEYLRNNIIRSKNDESMWEGLEFLYDDWDLTQDVPPSCIIFRKTGGGAATTGYSGFVFASGLFSASKSRNLSLIVTNRFDRAFVNRDDEFVDERGKLKQILRRGDKMFTQDGRYYLLSMKSLISGGVKVYAVSDCTEFMQVIGFSVVIEIVLSAVTALFIYISAHSIAGKKTDIMYELIRALEEAEKGNLEVKMDINSGDEFEKIGNSFNDMIGSLKHLIVRHQELSQENTLALVQMLESQFNPHFLYNTLESIRYMIKLEPGSAEKMIVSLSRLLRYSINKKEETVTLGEELNFVEQYLKIMLCRYGNRLSYRIDAGQASEVKVPRMILQPIVENSIEYGFEDRTNMELSITTKRMGNDLEICVRDNGKGIEPKLLEELQKNLKRRRNSTSHIGLYNVHRRINLLYEGDYGVYLESRMNKGTTIRLMIPAGEE